ncbi:MAG: ferritin-like domain-containing protein [Acidobacteriota bacterium]
MRLTDIKLNNLQDLYIRELKSLYYTENQIIDALPNMAEAATSAELATAFKTHLQQSKTQRERLERIFRRMDIEPEEEKSNTVAGLIDDGSYIIDAKGDAAVRDAALVAAAQKVEHHEIACYGCARTWARRLGFEEDARLLQQTLDEEGMTDKKLTTMAESQINVEAQQTVRR